MPEARPSLEPDAPAAFLAASPAAGWARAPLAGDASRRRYERLTAPDGRTAILMDARAEPASVAPFLRIAGHLRGLALAAPAVLHEGGGLLLLEDLGEGNVAAWAAARPADAPMLYEAAVDVLAHVQASPPPPGLLAFSPLRAAGLIAPLFEHAAPTDPRRGALLTGRLAEALAHAGTPDRLALRDFHAENLVWRPGRAGHDRLGLLDFQDAVLAPPAYDLASLLRDARADVAEDLRQALIRRFAAATGATEAATAHEAAAWGVQRNLRILGLFARFAAEGRASYMARAPRLRRHLAADLSHPRLRALDAAARAVLALP